MIPKTQSDIKNGFEFVTQPDLTFRLDPESMTIWDKISGINALRQAVYLALNIERYDWLIYSWNYGVELRDLIGNSVVLPQLLIRANGQDLRKETGHVVPLLSSGSTRASMPPAFF